MFSMLATQLWHMSAKIGWKFGEQIFWGKNPERIIDTYLIVYAMFFPIYPVRFIICQTCKLALAHLKEKR